MPAPIRITRTPSVTSVHDLEVLTFDTFDALHVSIQSAAGPADAKEDSDLIIPVAQWKTGVRQDADAQTMARVFCADIDRLTDDALDSICAALDGLSAIVWSTHNHRQPCKDGLNCIRVLIELDREYAPALHLALWDAVNERLCGLLDPATRKVSQPYYLPSHPSGAGSTAFCVSQAGTVFQVPVVAGAPEVTKVIAGAPSHQALGMVLTAWTRNAKDPERKAVAVNAKKILAHEPSVKVGEGLRETFLTSLAGYLASQFPSAAGIGALFEGVGWGFFAPDGKYAVSDLDEKITYFQRREKEQKATAQKAAVATSTGGARDYVLTVEEAAALATLYGDWQKHLIGTYKRDLYFLRPDGSYDPRPVMKENLFIAAPDRLAVFPNVEYTWEDDKGAHRKTRDAFLEEYSTHIEDVVFDMRRPEGGYDPKTGTIYFPAARPIVEPEGFEDIQDWLETMDPILLDMLSMMSKHGEALPALVLTGSSGIGKTLLARGVGQIYDTAPLTGKTAFANFNASAMVRQPIIFADEKLPEEYRHEGTTWIRDFVTQDSRLLDEKYQARVKLLGYPRLIIAANNEDVMQTREDMSREDCEAFAVRLVHVNMNAGKPFLDGLGRERIQREWIDGRRLAKHVLWLSKEWVVKNPGRRLAIDGNKTSLHEAMASKSGCAGEVAYWLLSYIADKNRDVVTKGWPVAMNTEKGWLRVSVKALVDHWAPYLDRNRRPPVPLIGRTVKALSLPGRQKFEYLEGGTKKTAHAYDIDLRLLRGENDVQRLVPDFDELFHLKEEP